MIGSHRKFRGARRVALLFALATIAAAVPIGDGANAATRAVTVTPAENLGTQVVKVSWSGFRPTQANGLYAVTILQCRALPGSVADCFTAAPFPNPENGTVVNGAVTGSDGQGSAFIEVRAAANLPALACSQTVPCSILAYEITGQLPPADRVPPDSALAALRFEPSLADCPAVTAFDVTSGGAASAAPLLYAAAGRRCTGADAQTIDFTETSSNLGRESFLTGEVDVGITSLAASPAELAAAPEHPDFAYAPVDLTAVAVVYNMTNPATGQRIPELTLSPRLVARIVSDSDLNDFFFDPELARLNPGVEWPAYALSPPLVRAERNADTWLLTDWLAHDAKARSFLDGNDADGVVVNPAWRGVAYPTDAFESRASSSAYLPRQGEAQVARRVFYGVRPADSTRYSSDYMGFVGVVDLPTAARYGLPTAKILNASGRGVAPTEPTILAGYMSMRRDGAGARLADFAAASPDAYPVKVDYAMIPRAAPPTKAASIASLVRYLVADAQGFLPAGYVRMPPDLVAEARAVAEALSPSPAPPAAEPSSGAGSSSASSSASVSMGSAQAGAGGTPATTLEVTKPRRRTARYLPVASYGASAARFALPALLVLGAVAALVAAFPFARRQTSRLVGARRTSATASEPVA